MSSRDLADNLQQLSRTMSLEKIAQVLTMMKKQNEPIEDDAIIQWFMYAPLVDLHDTTIEFRGPDFVEPVDHDGYGLLGYRKYIPDQIETYDLVHDNSNATGFTFPKPGNTEFQPATEGVKFSGAAKSDGSSYMLINQNAILNPTELTIAFWMNLEAFTGSARRILDKSIGNHDYQIQVRAGSDALFARIHNTVHTLFQSTNTAFTPNTWISIVVTLSAINNRLRIYKDKVQQGSDTVTTGSLEQGTENLAIFAEPGGTDLAANGDAIAGLVIADGEANQAWIDDYHDKGILGLDPADANGLKEITFLPFIDSLVAMPNATVGMFIAG